MSSCTSESESWQWFVTDVEGRDRDSLVIHDSDSTTGEAGFFEDSRSVLFCDMFDVVGELLPD